MSDKRQFNQKVADFGINPITEKEEEDLNSMFKELDIKLFGGRFSEEKVTIKWSQNLKKRKSRINNPKE